MQPLWSVALNMMCLLPCAGSLKCVQDCGQYPVPAWLTLLCLYRRVDCTTNFVNKNFGNFYVNLYFSAPALSCRRRNN